MPDSPLNAALRLYSGKPLEARRLALLNKDQRQRDFCLALAEYSAGNIAASRAALQRLIALAPDYLAAQISRTYAWYGEKDEAFRWLHRAIDLNNPGIAGIPEYDGFSDDPRYRRALQRMNLASI